MIEALLNNPLIVIILIGLISSLFRNQGERGQGKGTAKTERRADVGRQDHTPPKRNRSLFEELKKQLEETLPSLEAEKPAPRETFEANTSERNTPIAKNTEPEPIQTESFSGEERIPTLRPIGTMEGIGERKSKRPTTGSSLIPKATKKHVVEGIIWSEILGPPRAKKPYRPTHFRK